ncbi:uncharacterized protein LOC127131133 [Lathyrus oleraceus]|uniref:uncharacterized protein LOC127131133 n=1 Tax=Pisum sativum TaxID=3888 RepID=UPI0021CE9520|nr:uncharacterized protein LOC127131133 [Pisum sativum]
MIEKEDMEAHQAFPPKMKDPGKFTIACTIGGVKIPHALCDLGSSITVISLNTLKHLEIGDIIPSNMTLTLDDSYVTHPLGIVLDMLVQVNGISFPADFVVIDMKGVSGVTIILECTILAIGKALIDGETNEFILMFNKTKVAFHVYEWTSYMDDLETWYQLEEKCSRYDKGMKTRELTGVRASLASDMP